MKDFLFYFLFTVISTILIIGLWNKMANQNTFETFELGGCNLGTRIK